LNEDVINAGIGTLNDEKAIWEIIIPSTLFTKSWVLILGIKLDMRTLILMYDYIYWKYENPQVCFCCWKVQLYFGDNYVMLIR